MTKNKTLLVTNALPYANGPIHLGHMLEHIQSDIFVRFNRAIGNKVFYVCGDDCHGTPVMIKAGQMGITPEQMIEITSKDHAEDLKGFLVNYDNYYRTHSKENHEISSYMYEKAKENGYIKTETISQLYDPEKNMFLPDRFVKGTCPKCGAKDQYGDNCEVCGATYSPTELKDAYSVVSGAKPVLKESLHYFFDLPKAKDFLHDYIKNSGVIQTEMANKLEEWFTQGSLAKSYAIVIKFVEQFGVISTSQSHLDTRNGLLRYTVRIEHIVKSAFVHGDTSLIKPPFLF